MSDSESPSRRSSTEWRVAVGQRWQRLSPNRTPAGEPVTIAAIDGRIVRFEAEDLTTGCISADMGLFLPGQGYELVEEGESAPSLRERVARAMWTAMVNDEPPDVETLDREGFLAAADAAIDVVLDEDPDA